MRVLLGVLEDDHALRTCGLFLNSCFDFFELAGAVARSARTLGFCRPLYFPRHSSALFVRCPIPPPHKSVKQVKRCLVNASL